MDNGMREKSGVWCVFPARDDRLDAGVVWMHYIGAGGEREERTQLFVARLFAPACGFALSGSNHIGQYDYKCLA